MMFNLGIPRDANAPLRSNFEDELVLSLIAKSIKELAGPQSQPKHSELLSKPVLGGIIVRFAMPPRLRIPRYPYSLTTKA